MERNLYHLPVLIVEQPTRFPLHEIVPTPYKNEKLGEEIRRIKVKITPTQTGDANVKIKMPVFYFIVLPWL